VYISISSSYPGSYSPSFTMRSPVDLRAGEVVSTSPPQDQHEPAAGQARPVQRSLERPSWTSGFAAATGRPAVRCVQFVRGEPLLGRIMNRKLS
jgi:hypothetical protein